MPHLVPAGTSPFPDTDIPRLELYGRDQTKRLNSPSHSGGLAFQPALQIPRDPETDAEDGHV